jgi:uncharacterized protein YqfA (UPF0365 family)
VAVRVPEIDAVDARLVIGVEDRLVGHRPPGGRVDDVVEFGVAYGMAKISLKINDH